MEFAKLDEVLNDWMIKSCLFMIRFTIVYLFAYYSLFLLWCRYKLKKLLEYSIININV